MVRAGGLLWSITFSVVVKLNTVVHSTPEIASYYQCQYIPHVYKMAIKNADPCVHSQLTDDSRIKLLKAFNQFRSHTSRGLVNGVGASNVYYMRYHWLCEFYAAYYIREHLTGLLQTVEENNRILSSAKDFLGVRPSFGSLSNVADEKSTYVTAEDSFRAYDIRLNESKQTEFIRAYIMDLHQIQDRHLLTVNISGSPHETVLPGTTHFGCSIRFYKASRTPDWRKTGHKFLNGLTCVFLTLKVAEKLRTYEDDIMTNATCNAAPPGGTFLPDVNLCLDNKSIRDSAVNDMPCQFYYDISAERLPAVLKTCNGEDPKADTKLLSPADGYRHAKILYNGEAIDFGFDPVPINIKVPSHTEAPEPKLGTAYESHFSHLYAIVLFLFIVILFISFYLLAPAIAH